MKYSTLVTLALALGASALPHRRPFRFFSQENLQDAEGLNEKFNQLTPDSSCQNGIQACINGQFAVCSDNGKFVIQGCPRDTTCAALPLVNVRGTSVGCDTQSNIDARLGGNSNDPSASSSAADTSTSTLASGAAPTNSPVANPVNTVAAASSAASSAAASSTASANAPANTASSATPNNADLQNSLTLDPSLINTGFLNDGQAQPEAGQVPSLTSGNNFINFCATSQLPLTNGKQIQGGSCNPAPMGLIPSVDNMPSAKFTFPLNNGNVAANQPFTISVAIKNMETGNFVNAQQNYFAAPQQLNAQGQIRGHSHVVVEQLDSLTQTTPTDPKKFAFFKGLNAAAVDGILKADVAAGLPAGVYRVSTINTAANHQPVLLPVAQHGSPEDAVYFTVA